MRSMIAKEKARLLLRIRFVVPEMAGLVRVVVPVAAVAVATIAANPFPNLQKQ